MLEIEEFETGKKKFKKGGAKHHKLMHEGERPGRLTRQEKKYRQGKDHSGKGKTLRNHRS